ncbi:MAG: radical SAM protein [Elusimicrobiota bacterium]
MKGVEVQDRNLLLYTASGFSKDRGAINAFIGKYRAIVDSAIARILEGNPQVIGFSLYDTNRIFTEEIVRQIKKTNPGSTIVFGGPHARHLLSDKSQIPDTVDAIIPGEGEEALPLLLDNLHPSGTTASPGTWMRHGHELLWGGNLGKIADLDRLPFPDFSDLPLEAYLPPLALPSYFGRGCFLKCQFCEEWNTLAGARRDRSAQRVFDEVRHLLSSHSTVMGIDFHDPLINSDMEILREFCRLVIAAKASGALPQSFHWQGQAILRREMDRDMLSLMHSAGCTRLAFGMESGSDAILRAMKKTQTIETAEGIFRDSSMIGITNCALMMVGYPGETEKDFNDTIYFLKKNAPHISFISMVAPSTLVVPGTPIHRSAHISSGVAPHEWQSKDGENTYPVRLERFARMCEAALAAGISLTPSTEQMFAHKDEYLRNYYKTAGL